MESIYGKQARLLDRPRLAERLGGYTHCLADIGTGDGRFVQHVAQRWPGYFALGIDACRENLRVASQRAPDNVVFIIANACALPAGLHGLASHITVNFPWGSLLSGLLTGDRGLYSGLVALARPGAQLEVRVNGGALSEAGWSLAAGVDELATNLGHAGFELRKPNALCAADLRTLPTTWAKRLAFGRDPRAVALTAQRDSRASRTQLHADAAFNVFS